MEKLEVESVMLVGEYETVQVGAAEDFVALQLAVVPPLIPAQVQIHGPVPVTAEGVPAVQRLVVGIEARVWPLELPQVPLVPLVGV